METKENSQQNIKQVILYTKLRKKQHKAEKNVQILFMYSCVDVGVADINIIRM